MEPVLSLADPGGLRKPLPGLPKPVPGGTPPDEPKFPRLPGRME